MKKGIATHLRRNLALLEWINNEKADASVWWRGSTPAAWRDLEPLWKSVNNRIRLQFLVAGRIHAFDVASLRLSGLGAQILLRNPHRPIPETLQICWKSMAPQAPTPGGDLWGQATRWLACQFPGYRIIRASQYSDRRRSFSRSVLRILLRVGEKARMLLMPNPESAADRLCDCLTQGLLWANFLYRRGLCVRPVPIVLIIPACAAGQLVHRTRYLNQERVRVEVWVYDPASEIRAAKRLRHAPLPIENRDFRWPVLGPFRWSPLLARVIDLAPDLIRRHPSFHQCDTLRLRGLEFGRVFGPARDRIVYGVGRARTLLTEDRFDELRLLVEEILYYRRPDSPNPRHPYYRLRGERWLEAMILEAVSRLFPELAAESVYSQIPVYLGKTPGRVDILGIDKSGTLTVMELKVAADPGLPLQALDYWGRVIGHNQRGDFERRGYFSGANLNRTHPRIYLISPIFAFHDSTDQILRYLDPRLEVWKIAINENWRNGVKLLRRERVLCGDLNQ
jgi:hypothetical protein